MIFHQEDAGDSSNLNWCCFISQCNFKKFISKFFLIIILNPTVCNNTRSFELALLRSYVHCSTLFRYKPSTVWTYLVGRWAHGALGSELQTALIVRVVHGSGRQLRVRVILLLHRSIRQTSAEALAERTSANMLLLPSNTKQHLLLMGLFYMIVEEFSMTEWLVSPFKSLWVLHFIFCLFYYGTADFCMLMFLTVNQTTFKYIFTIGTSISEL